MFICTSSTRGSLKWCRFPTSCSPHSPSWHGCVRQRERWSSSRKTSTRGSPVQDIRQYGVWGRDRVGVDCMKVESHSSIIKLFELKAQHIPAGREGHRDEAQICLAAPSSLTKWRGPRWQSRYSRAPSGSWIRMQILNSLALSIRAHYSVRRVKKWLGNPQQKSCHFMKW